MAAGAPQAPGGTPVPDRGGFGIAAPCPDADLDGYVVCSGCQQQTKSCGECDDSDPAIHPGATEVCNQKDDDCDGAPDEGFPSVDTSRTVRNLNGQSFDNFGSAIVGLGDVDGDGIPDQAIGAQFWDNPAQVQVGSIQVVSGADGSPVCRMLDPQGGSSSNLGSNGVLVGDFNGDGVSDLAARSGGFTCVFSPVNCSLLLRCPSAGAALGAPGDLNLDGTPDLVFGNPSGAGGSVIAVSGATCGTLFTYTDPIGQGLGSAVTGIADITGDGRRDLLATANSLVYVLSGVDGALVRQMSEPATSGLKLFTGAIVALPDISGDGLQDLAVGTVGNNTLLDSPGSVLIMSPVNGVTLRRCVDPAALAFDRLGFALAAVPDQDGDGLPEVLAGAPYADAPGSPDAGSALLFSSADCSLLRRYDNPRPYGQVQFGSSVAALGDLSGDGRFEIAVGMTRDPELANFQSVVLFAHESVCDADGMSPFQGDCDDTSSTTFRGAPELCDARDNDCDAVEDEDSDGDLSAACDDCDVLNPRIHPGAAEVCNGRDDDCDGATDEGADADADGATTTCDCNDGDASVHPGAAETCDHVDRNCDGRMDEGSASDGVLVSGPDPSAGQGIQVVDLAALGDVNGDGVSDFVAGAPTLPSSGVTGGAFVLYSGRDRTEICRGFDPTPSLSDGFATSLATLPDVSGDGIPDIAVGVPGDAGVGAVSIHSGADCSFVRRCTDPQLSFARLGYDLAVVGDLSGDGIPEIAASAPSAQSSTGQVTLIDPVTCVPGRRLVDPNGVGNAPIGQAVAAIGDVDGDSWPDIAVGEHTDAVNGIASGSVLIYSGATGALIRRLRPPDPQPDDMFGWALAAIGDVNGDGVLDLAVAAWFDQVGGGPIQQGSILLYSGRDGALLRLCTVPQIRRLGTAVAAAGDVTGDGVPDLIAGADDSYSAFPVYRSESGRVVLLSGADCSLVQSYIDPASRQGDRLGLALLAPGSIGGDPGPEFVASSRRGLFFINREADCDGDSVTSFRGDCDETDPARAAGRVEICDGKDNDCDLSVDEDGDGDGFAVCADCDDTRSSVHPGGSEVCDLLDDDCDGAIDEGFDPDGDGAASCADNCPAVANPGQADAEGDGIGDACDTETCDGFDNDGDGAIDEGFAAIPETCNHLDDNCDGAVDPGSVRALNHRPITPPAGMPGGAFGFAVAGVGDVNGDHVPDFVIGANGATISGNGQAGHAFIVSGATQSLICELLDPEGQFFDNLGQTLAGVGDVTGDGVPDVAAGSPQDFSGSGQAGSVSIFSGADCSFVRKCADPAGVNATSYGQSLAGLGDVTGDGVPDLAAGSFGDNAVPARVLVYSGADCSVVRTLTDPLVPLGSPLGTSIVATGDLSGDGVADLLAGATGGNGSAVLFSLADGSVMRRLTDPGAPAGAALGSSVALLPDIDSDGIADLVVGAMNDDAPLKDGGSVSIFSGASGALLRKCTDPQGSPLAQLGMSVAAYPDWDGDGRADIVALAPRQHTAHGPRNGTVLVFSGATCAVLARLNPDSGQLLGGLIGDRLVAVPGDLDGDHASEVVVGLPALGLVQVFGRTGDCDGDGATPLGGDCDDASAARTPGHVELCDTIDNDCDAQVDEDSDGDGFAACADCDNGRAAAFPGAPETCNGLDDDCNLLADDGPDVDGDGVTAVCDCQDRNASMRPGATEICNRLDDDCDGRIDEALPQARVAALVTDPAGTATGMLGSAVAGMGDVDGDAVVDYAATNSSQVLFYSGLTGAVRCRAASLSSIAVIGDVNGDAIQDVVVRVNGPSVAVLSGATCSVLRTCGVQGVTSLGSSLAALGDVNGDGIPDYAAGSPNQTTAAPAGQVFVFSGNSCTPLYSVTDPTLSAGAFFGGSVAGPGDVTGDGWPDLVVGAPSDASLGITQAGRLVVVSGPDGNVVRRLHDPAAAAGDTLGTQLAAAGDLDGDGVRDLLAYIAADAPFKTNVGAVLLFSGVGDTVLRRCTDPLASANQAFGSTLAAAGDLTGDGVPDFVAAERISLPGADSAGSVLLVSSADCGIVARLNHPSPVSNENLAVTGLAVPGDLTGDGRSDILAGADSSTFPNPRGHLVVFSETSSCESPDNCPTVPNPFQADSDGDVRGNLCDLCATTADPLQTDTDKDGAGDACDCRPTDAFSRTPGHQVRIDVTLQGRVLWTPAESAEAYVVRRGDLAAKAYGTYGACWQYVPGTRAGDTGVVDAEVPAVGTGFFYFVHGEDTACGRQSLGFDSLERPRILGVDICP